MQDDLNLHILRILEGIFLLDVAYMTKVLLLCFRCKMLKQPCGYTPDIGNNGKVNCLKNAKDLPLRQRTIFIQIRLGKFYQQ